MRLGTVGIWDHRLRSRDSTSPGHVVEAAAELDELGYSTLWIPGGAAHDDFDNARAVLAATRRCVVATGILNIWMHEPHAVATSHAALATRYPDRFLLGLGVSHADFIDTEHERRYRNPLATMAAYLDELDSPLAPVPTSERVIGALGPRMVELARDRTGGVHPFLVTAEHTRRARERLGPDRLLAPEVTVVLDHDADTARQLARGVLARFSDRPNYRRNLLRLGFTEDDLAGGGSDRLIGALIAHPDAAAVVQRVQQHLLAGADHVSILVLTRDQSGSLPRAEWRELADALIKR